MRSVHTARKMDGIVWLEKNLQEIYHVLWSYPGITTLVIGASGLLYYVMSHKKGKAVLKVPEGAVEVGKVSRVTLYPVKAMRNIAQQKSLVCDHMGMKTHGGIRDRSWMVTLENGSMITHGNEPKLVLIQPSISPNGDYLLLDAPDMSTLKVSTNLTPKNSPTLDVNVWGLHSDAVICGEEASAWLCKFLGKKGHLLVYHPPSMEGRTINNGPLDLHKMFRKDNKVAFVQVAPVLLMTESTVADVNQRVKETAITEKNFRPNVYIEGPNDPYEEDKWDKVCIGKQSVTVLENTIISKKCLATTVDPSTGIMDRNKSPLEVIRKYRPKVEDGSPCLGIFMSVLQGGEIKVGDTVYATYKK